MPGNRLTWRILEWEPEETRRKGRHTERWIDGERRSVTNHGQTEEDATDRDMCGNVVVVKENHCSVGNPWMNKYINEFVIHECVPYWLY